MKYIVIPLLIFALSAVALSGCLLTEARQDTGQSPVESAITTGVSHLAVGDWLGAIIGAGGALISGAAVVGIQRTKKKQLAEIVTGIQEFIYKIDPETRQILLTELSKAMDAGTKDVVRALKPKPAPVADVPKKAVKKASKKDGNSNK